MSSTSTLTVAPADEKEAAIIAAARAAFLAHGFNGASMDAIALAANVSKRTVYNRFRSKEALFAAAILETCQRILPFDLDHNAAGLPLEEFMRELGRTFLRGLVSPDAVALRRIAAFEAAREPALGEAYLEHGPRWMAKTVRPLIERIMERMPLKIGDLDRAVWQLGALMTEPLYTEILMGAQPTDLEAAINDQVDTAITAFLKIYAPA